MIGVPDVARGEDRLRQLEVAVSRRLDGLLQGDYQGLVPAAGSEPGEGRPYSPGDDVRRMDWNLTARSGAPHIRTTVADRELETWVVADGSASMDFGTADHEKRDLGLAAVAAFAFLTVRNGNRIGAVLLDGSGARVVPPRSGRAAALALLHTVADRSRAAPAPVELAGGLRRARLAARRRGLVVVVSDLLDDSPWERELRALSSRHDTVVVDVRDPRESALPAVGLLSLVDPETGRLVEVQTSSPRLRARFATAAAAQLEERRRAVRSAGAAHLVLGTDRDWLREVVAFVAARRRRR
ncbi:MAG TPA: DUF58 domain-containing protein [Acidimicrobiales bacterium]|nr:DUF58 domain-containing protein [Acidimicrobiales bacterium]